MRILVRSDGKETKVFQVRLKGKETEVFQVTFQNGGTMTEQEKMAATAYAALDEKKGADIKVIQISEVSIMTDYFIIASAGSTPQVQALINNVEEKMQEQGYQVKRIEGTRNSSWVLMDYGDVVVHIFDMEDRLFYDLERIWSDGKVIDPAQLQG